MPLWNAANCENWATYHAPEKKANTSAFRLDHPGQLAVMCPAGGNFPPPLRTILNKSPSAKSAQCSRNLTGEP
jgi:hypothetical protein